MASTHAQRHPSTIDPFVFPSDTTFRFILLIISVIGLSLYLYDLLYHALYIHLILEQNNRCLSFLADAAALTPDEFIVAHSAQAHCNAPYNLDRALWIVAALVGQLVVGTAIYWLLPPWKVHREKLKPLSAAEHPQLVAALFELCQKAGVRSTLRFVWNPLSGTSGGLAFGRLGRYYVRLNGGLVAQFYADQDRPTFDAIMLHELAHLRNADVDKTYFAVATTIAFCLTAIVPYFLLLLRSVIMFNSTLFALDMVLRTAIMVALVYLVFSAILRAREFFADVRAASSGSSSAALSHVVGAVKSAPPSRWRAIWSVHPSAEARRSVLAEPQRLLHMGFWEAFATGLVASIAFKSVFSFTQTLSSGLEVGEPSQGLLAGLIFGPLAAGIIGSGVWRMTFRAADANHRSQGLPWLALGLSLGVALGQMIAFEALFSTRFSSPDSLLDSVLAPESPLVFIGSRVISFGLLFVGVLVLLHWIRDSALAWMRITLARAVPSSVYTLSLVIASSTLAIWMSMLFQLDLLGASSRTLSEFSNLFWLSLLSFPVSITIPILVGLALLPLSATFWAQKTGAFPTLSAVRRTFRPGLVIVASISGGIAYTTLLFAFHAWLSRYGQQELRMSDESALFLAEWSIARAMIMQVLVAAIVAGLAQRLPAWQAVAAAVVTGCLITASIILVNKLDGCIEVITLRPGRSCSAAFPWSFGLFAFGKVVSTGGLAALPVAVGVAVLARRFQSLVRIGVLVGLIFCGLWLTTNIFLSFGFLPPSSLLWGDVWVPLAGVCLVIAAALAARRAGRRRVLHALLGAFVAASIEILGLLGLQVSNNRFGKLQPDIAPVAYYNRGDAYRDRGEYSRAIADYDQALNLKPEYVDAYFDRGNAYLQKGEYDHAIADYDQVLKRKPDYVDAYTVRGLAFTHKGEYDRAIADYDQALNLKPEYVDAYFDRGNAYLQKGEYDHAIADYDQVLKRKPDYVDAYTVRGLAFTHKGEYDRAIADYGQALNLKRDYVGAYLGRGMVYQNKGEYDRAIADYDQAIKLQPNNAEAYNNRGRAYEQKGENDRALEDYFQALQIHLQNQAKE